MKKNNSTQSRIGKFLIVCCLGAALVNTSGCYSSDSDGISDAISNITGPSPDPGDIPDVISEADRLSQAVEDANAALHEALITEALLEKQTKDDNAAHEINFNYWMEIESNGEVPWDEELYQESYKVTWDKMMASMDAWAAAIEVTKQAREDLAQAQKALLDFSA